MIDLTTSPAYRAWRRVLPCVLALSASFLSMAPPLAHAAGPASPSRQFTFAWPFTEGGALAPRGGSTRGAPDRDRLFGSLVEMTAALEGGERPGDQEKWQADVRAAVREYLR